jgi:hypothetical protein
MTNTQSSRIWYSVETPSVFAEYSLPRYAEDYTRDDKRNSAKLADLAEDYGTHIITSSVRRG